jgi:hypothetical protein
VTPSSNSRTTSETTRASCCCAFNSSEAGCFGAIWVLFLAIVPVRIPGIKIRHCPVLNIYLDFCPNILAKLVETLGTACGCVRGVESHPLQKRQRMGHPRDGEFINFLEALQEMPWSWRNRAREGELTVPLTVSAE